MDLEDVREHLAAIDGVKEKGRGWYVDDRLVARDLGDEQLLVRADFGAREALVDDFPDTFSVPPHVEGHMKVVVELDRADPDGVRRALDEAVALQRR